MAVFLPIFFSMLTTGALSVADIYKDSVASGFKLEILASHLRVQLRYVIAHVVFNTGILNHVADFVFLGK